MTADVEMPWFETHSDATVCEMGPKACVPNIWLNAYNDVNLEKELNEHEIYCSQYKRTAEGRIPLAGQVVVNKKLCFTPSPNGTPRQGSKYALTSASKSQSKYKSHVCQSKDRLSCGKSVSKKSKNAASVLP